MVKLGALVGRLNLLENKVNALRSAFSGHTHTGTVVNATPINTQLPVTLTTNPGPVVSGSLTLTLNSDIENPKVKQ
jgi:hypothetical protein